MVEIRTVKDLPSPLILPESAKKRIEAIPKQFEAVLSSLPLDQCSWERNPVTQEVGWKAPEGYNFRISGNISVAVDGLIQKEEVKDFIYTASEDDPVWKAFVSDPPEMTVEMVYDPIKEYRRGTFEGPWLVFSPNLDGTNSVLDGLQDYVDWKGKGKSRLLIKSHPRAFPGWDIKKFTLEAVPNMTEEVVFILMKSSFGYIQTHAQGRQRFILSLVEVGEEEAPLYTAPPTEVGQELLTGYVRGRDNGKTSVEVFELERGRPHRDIEELEQFRRKRREANVPFPDDKFTKEIRFNMVEFELDSRMLEDEDRVRAQMAVVEDALETDKFRPRTPGERFGHTTLFLPFRKEIIKSKSVIEDGGVITVYEPPKF